MARDAVTLQNSKLGNIPLSHAVRLGASLYVSGQIGLDPETGALAEGGAGAETERAFENLKGVLDAAGKSLDDIVKVNVYLTDMGDFAAMNHVYASAFEKPYPARTCIAVRALPFGAAVEIEAVAG